MATIRKIVLSNIFQSCRKLVALLQEDCRYLKLWHRLSNKPLSYTVLAVTWNWRSLFLETWIYLYDAYKTAHAASDDFSFHLFMREFKNSHKMCSKACATTQDFPIESTASALMSGDVQAIKTIYNFYIRIPWTIKTY